MQYEISSPRTQDVEPPQAEPATICRIDIVNKVCLGLCKFCVRSDTLWKAFNCVTYNEDHLRGGVDNGDSRLKNTFTMNGADNIKTRSMTQALELV